MKNFVHTRLQILCLTTLFYVCIHKNMPCNKYKLLYLHRAQSYTVVFEALANAPHAFASSRWFGIYHSHIKGGVAFPSYLDVYSRWPVTIHTPEHHRDFWVGYTFLLGFRDKSLVSQLEYRPSLIQGLGHFISDATDDCSPLVEFPRVPALDLWTQVLAAGSEPGEPEPATGSLLPSAQGIQEDLQKVTRVLPQADLSALPPPPFP